MVCIKRHIYSYLNNMVTPRVYLSSWKRAGSRWLSVLTAFHNWQFILRNHKLESHLICLRQIAATGFNVSWANTVITRETRRSRQKSSLPANAASGNFHAPNKNPAQQAFPTSVLWFAEVHRTWMHYRRYSTVALFGATTFCPLCNWLGTSGVLPTITITISVSHRVSLEPCPRCEGGFYCRRMEGAFIHFEECRTEMFSRYCAWDRRSRN